MPLNAGDLRESVVVEYAIERRTDEGETIPVWETLARRRASVRPLSYMEQQQTFQTGGSASHAVAIRYCDGVTGGMRLRWESRGDRKLYISSVIEHGDREGHELICEERA